MDAEHAFYYTREVMVVLKREFQTPDEEMKKIVLKVGGGGWVRLSTSKAAGLLALRCGLKGRLALGLQLLRTASAPLPATLHNLTRLPPPPPPPPPPPRGGAGGGAAGGGARGPTTPRRRAGARPNPQPDPAPPPPPPPRAPQRW
jgi:hypothetical protein